MAKAENLVLRVAPIVEPKPLTYLCRFDENGRRGETHLSVDYTDEQKEAMIADGFVEITPEEWEYYVGNKGTGDNGTGYIRDSQTGKPVSAPEHIPTKAEKLASLEFEYKSEKSKLEGYFTTALLMGDTETQDELKEELQELEGWYTEEQESINGGAE